MDILNIIRRNVLWLSGFAMLAVPTLWELSTKLWNKVDQEHGPIILLLVLWVSWRELPALLTLPEKRSHWGWMAVIPALCLYILGRSQEICCLKWAVLFYYWLVSACYSKGGQV